MKRFIDFANHLIESLTIPQNENDRLEVELYKKLDKGYEHSDRIIRWYRNAKKQGADEKELKSTFIDNLVNIKDLFKTYETYVERLKKNKMLNRKVELTVGGKKLQFDPMKDIDKIRRLEGFQMFVNAIGDTLHSSTTIDTSKQKYAITDSDRKKIRLVGFTESVMCWCTEGYETTNKFIFQLWQNDKTLGRGDVYGDPKHQTPYCTHSKEHWDDYANEYEKYQQFWFIERPDNRMTYAYEEFMEMHDNAKELLKNVNLQIGDLTNENVVYMFNLMKGLGPDGLIAMNDTGNDLLDRYDQHVTNISDLGHSGEIKTLCDEIFKNGSMSTITVGGVQVHLKQTDALMLKADTSGGYTGGGIAIDGDDYNYQEIESLKGCPQEVSGSFSIYRLPRVRSLVGCPKSVVGSFVVREIPIESLEGCPDIRVDKGHKLISVARTDIKNLKGIDPDFDGQIELFGNENFSSFEGTPINCWLEIEDENMETLRGIPEKFRGSLILSLPKLKSLDYAPRTCHQFSLGENSIVSYDSLQEYEKYRGFNSLIKDVDDEQARQKLQYWYDIHTMPDGEHYRQNGPTYDKAVTMGLDELKKIYANPRNMANESTIDEVETSKTASYKFEEKIADNIRKFISTYATPEFDALEVHHYEESDSKYHSDIYVENTRNGKQVWIEAKKNKYANLGSSSFKYADGKWSCTTLSEDEPLAELYLDVLEEHASKFITFCKDYLGKDDIQIPTDLTEDLVDAWKDSGNISDTENDVQFITNKIPIEGFGVMISEFYKTAKDEPVHYVQVADDLYIIDPAYNPLGLMTRNGSGLMSLTEAYRIGRIQFRLKGQHHTSVSGEDVMYYSVFLDVKILSDDDNDTTRYSCSFLTPEKFPVVERTYDRLDEAEEIRLLTHVSVDNIKNIIKTVKTDNKRFSKTQFSKYFKVNSINWCILCNRDENLAIAAVLDNDPFNGHYFIAEIQRLKRGYGKTLIEEIVKRYRKVWLMSDPSASDELLGYYRGLDMKEIVATNPSKKSTTHFFCTKQCDFEKLEQHCKDMWGKPDDDTSIGEADRDIGGDASDFNISGKKVWIDDIRPAPAGYRWFKTVHAFIDYAHENGVDDIVLYDTDHDAGEYQTEGGDYVVCFRYLERCGVKDVLVHIHSSNPVGANSIRKIISRNKANGWREIRNTN